TLLMYRAMAMLDLPKPNLDEMIADLTAARQGMPDAVEPRQLLVECYRRKNDFDAEFRELEDLVRAAPTNRRGWSLLLDAYASSHPPRWADGERVVETIKNVPELTNDVDMLMATALFEARRGDALSAHDAFQAALKDLQAAYKQQPKNTFILQT